jgi:hypothetical protein
MIDARPRGAHDGTAGASGHIKALGKLNLLWRRAGTDDWGWGYDGGWGKDEAWGTAFQDRHHRVKLQAVDRPSAVIGQAAEDDPSTGQYWKDGQPRRKCLRSFSRAATRDSRSFLASSAVTTGSAHVSTASTSRPLARRATSGAADRPCGYAVPRLRSVLAGGP